MKAKSILLLSVLFALYGCEKESDKGSLQNHTNYYPINLGDELEYKIDSIAYDEFTGRVDTFKYLLKEIVEEELIGLDQSLSYRIGVYVKKNDTLPWKKSRIIQKSILNTRIEVLDNNLITIPMTFPVSLFVNWDVNSKNTRSSQEFQYESIHEKETLNQISYDSISTIIEKDVFSFIERDYAFSKYAAGLGLVIREEVSIQKNLNQDTISGFLFKKKIIR